MRDKRHGAWKEINITVVTAGSQVVEGWDILKKQTAEFNCNPCEVWSCHCNICSACRLEEKLPHFYSLFLLGVSSHSLLYHLLSNDSVFLKIMVLSGSLSDKRTELITLSALLFICSINRLSISQCQNCTSWKGQLRGTEVVRFRQLTGPPRELAIFPYTHSQHLPWYRDLWRWTKLYRVT